MVGITGNFHLKISLAVSFEFQKILRNTLLVTNSCLLCYDCCSVTDLKTHFSYDKMYSYIGLLFSVPMAASPALKMVSAVRLICTQWLQQLDFLLPLCVCFNDIIPKAKTEILLILENFMTNSDSLREYSCTKNLVPVSQSLLVCVHCINKEKTHLFKYPSQVSEAETGSVCHEYATTLKEKKYV